MGDMRSIGDEFEVFFPRSRNCSDTRGRIIRYRVVTHDLVSDFERGPTRLAERLEPIEIKHVKMTELTFDGELWRECYETGEMRAYS